MIEVPHPFAGISSESSLQPSGRAKREVFAGDSAARPRGRGRLRGLRALPPEVFGVGDHAAGSRG